MQKVEIQGSTNDDEAKSISSFDGALQVWQERNDTSFNTIIVRNQAKDLELLEWWLIHVIILTVSYSYHSDTLQ